MRLYDKWCQPGTGDTAAISSYIFYNQQISIGTG